MSRTWESSQTMTTRAAVCEKLNYRMWFSSSWPPQPDLEVKMSEIYSNKSIKSVLTLLRYKSQSSSLIQENLADLHLFHKAREDHGSRNHYTTKNVTQTNCFQHHPTFELLSRPSCTTTSLLIEIAFGCMSLTSSTVSSPSLCDELIPVFT